MRHMMKVMASVCFGLLIFAWNQTLSGSLVNSNEDVILEIAVTEDGSGFVCTPRKIFQVIKKQSEDSKVPGYSDEENGIDAVGAKSLKVFKNNVYYILNGELWQLNKGKLIGNDVIVKTMGSACAIQTTAFDANGQMYLLVTDENSRTAILKRNQNGTLTKLMADGVLDEIKEPVSMTIAGESSLLIQCKGKNHCEILCLLQKKIIGSIPLGNVTSLTYDHFGRLYGVDQSKNCIVVQTHPGNRVQSLPQKHIVAVAYDPARNCLQAIDAKTNKVISIPTGDPALPVDESPLPFTVAPAFPNIEWAGWEPVNDKGVAVPLRPIVLTHANDQSGRTFVATQQGVIHVFPNKPDVKKTKIFLDIQDRVTYKDTQNEEGFLGLAFHPKYKQNGEFFVYYTKKPGLLSVVSRFKVSKDDPDKADPNSEEVLLTLKQPMWNHNGGTVCFGHDGFLYIGLGDGGGANDMFKNSRKMNTFHSKILRIDVDSKSNGKPYGIPADNPFVGKDEVLPEIYCYGIRNVWRLAFDRKTGQGWFGEVGQNLYEEINLLEKGADYGWNPRESFHPFGAASQAANDKMVEPVWEYHHDVGKSITGGNVYRGKAYPELDGMYLYADYVSARIWALKYDFDQKRVVANREIKHRGLPIMSFGEDEDGETYLLTFSANGQGIDKIVPKK